jgi:uncharacterized delta-60 repeat protein
MVWVAPLAIAVLFLAGSAHARPGSLDPTFGAGGKVLTNIGLSSEIRGVALQRDRKIVAAGQWSDGRGLYSALARYKRNGSPDRSFGHRGVVASKEDAAWAVAIQSDQKIVVAGGSGGRFAVFRYSSRGRLDRSFGSGGKVISPFEAFGRALGVAIDATGRIVAVGRVYVDGAGRLAVARFLSDGRLDPTFGDQGAVVTRVTGSASAWSVRIQADGRIVVAGSSFVGHIAPADNVRRLGGTWGNRAFGHSNSVVVRYEPDGTLDQSFGSAGIVEKAQGEFADFNDLLLQRDGKITLVGSVDYRFMLVRYRKDGSPDPSFGEGLEPGVVRTRSAYLSGAYAGALQRDGKIVAGGYGTEYGNKPLGFTLARYRSNGLLDQSFGRHGVVTTRVTPDGFDVVNALALQRDGKIVAAGSAVVGGKERFALARYMGSYTCHVPRVKGKLLRVAKRKIRRAHCSVGRVKRAYSSEVEKSHVISQRPKAGSRRPDRAKIRLAISKGRRPAAR